MYDKEQLNAFAKEFMAPRLDRSMRRLQQAMGPDGLSIKKELLSCVDSLFKRCICQQQEGRKQAVRYIHFFYLRLSVLTRQYDIQISAFSEQSYMDNVETMTLWNSDFIMKYYEEDMREMEKEAKKQIIRFSYPQLMELRERSFALYVALLGQYFASVAEDITGLETFRKMKKSENMQIVFGGYMDRGMQIWPLTVRERE